MPLTRESNLGATFDRLWAASLSSNVADGLISTAAPLLAITLTRDPFIIALYSAVPSLPWLLFAVPIGGLADRVDRGIALAVANATRFVLVLIGATAVLFGWMTLPLLFVITFLAGICEVFVDTTTQAVLPMILEQDQFERGNARMSIAESMVQTFVGAPLGGFLFAAAMSLPFFLGVGGYLAAAGIIMLMITRGQHRLRANRSAERQHFVADLKDGIRFLWEHRMLRAIVLFTTTVYIFFNVAHATMALFVIDEIGVPEAWFGAVLTAGGIGYIGGSAVAPRISKRFGRGPAMAWTMVGSLVFLIGEGFSPNVWVLMLMMSSGSFLIAIWNILLMSSYQVLIPTDMFGRVHGARRTLVWGLGPIGAVIGGWVASVGGLRLPILLGGGLALVLTLLNMRMIIRLGDTTSPTPVTDVVA